MKTIKKIMSAEVYLGDGIIKAYHVGEESVGEQGGMVTTTNIRLTGIGAILIEFSNGEHWVHVNAPSKLVFKDFEVADDEPVEEGV